MCQLCCCSNALTNKQLCPPQSGEETVLFLLLLWYFMHCMVGVDVQSLSMILVLVLCVVFLSSLVKSLCITKQLTNRYACTKLSIFKESYHFPSSFRMLISKVVRQLPLFPLLNLIFYSCINTKSFIIHTTHHKVSFLY